MTQDEILEYNKKCAEFLGVDINYSKEVYKDSKSQLRQYIHNKPKSESLLFHSDWNWIMEVVEGIEKVKCNFTIKTQWNEFNEQNYTQVTVNKREGEMSRDRTAIYNSVDVYNHHSPTFTSKKEAVIHSINQFLIWYNSNK
jgi:hypothetical protein